MIDEDAIPMQYASQIECTHQLMGAYVLREVPLLDTPGLVARDELSLIRVNAYVVHWKVRVKNPQRKASAELKYLVLRYCNFCEDVPFCSQSEIRSHKDGRYGWDVP